MSSDETKQRIAKEALLQIQAIADMIRSNYSWQGSEHEAVLKAAQANPDLYKLAHEAGLI